jgi:hypothetical protein
MRGLEADGSLKTNSGISGLTNEVNPVRFWAGDTFENRNNAPFRVRHDGSLVALNAMLQGGLKTAQTGKRIEIRPWRFSDFITPYPTDVIAMYRGDNEAGFLVEVEEIHIASGPMARIYYKLKVIMKDLPTTDTELSQGQIWNDNGT